MRRERPRRNIPKAAIFVVRDITPPLLPRKTPPKHVPGGFAVLAYRIKTTTLFTTGYQVPGGAKYIQF